MDQQILDFLNSERVGALTILMSDGAPHSAAIHFSFSDSPELQLYFSTENTSRKCDFLKSSKTAKASFVVGFSEEVWKTFQADGMVEAVEGDELAKAKEIHYAKNPGSKKFEGDPKTVFLKFTPSWYRYSDLGAKPPVFVEK